MHASIRVALVALIVIAVVHADDSEKSKKTGGSKHLNRLREQLQTQRKEKSEACAKAVAALDEQLKSAQQSLSSLQAQLQKMANSTDDARVKALNGQLHTIAKVTVLSGGLV